MTVRWNRKGLRAVEALAKAEVVRIAEDIFEDSQRRVPVDSGTLKGSGRVVETDTGAEVVYDADYAAHVEYGTSTQRAQPYLGPAAVKKR